MKTTAVLLIILATLSMCVSLVLGQTTPIRNPVLSGTGSVPAGSTLGIAGTLNGAGTFNMASGTVALPGTVSGGLTSFQAADADLTALAAIAGVQGDIIYHNGTNWVRLAKGTGLQTLRVNAGATALEWATGGAGSVATDTIFDAAGDLVVGTGADTAARLAMGTPLQALRVNAGGTALEWATPTSGTVTSVSGSGGTTGLTLSGGPITSSGTLTLGGILAEANGGTGVTSLAGFITNAMLAGSIAASKLVGTDIATVGTITSGTWNGTALTDAYVSDNITATNLVTTTGPTVLVAGAIADGEFLKRVGSTIVSATAGTGTVTHTGALTADSIVIGNGASDLKVTTTGTGVVTALGVATNAAGGFVVTDGAATLSNKTLTAPKFADLGFIADANGNELIILDTVASATNELTVANAINGSNPTITTTGSSDSNISLTITPKGSGRIVLPPPAVGTARTIDFSTGYGSAALWLYNTGSAMSRYGWGLQGGEMQFFTVDGTTIFTFTQGGDLQSSSTKESMRLSASDSILTLKAAGVYGFSSTTSSGGSRDTSISRTAPGVVGIGNGATGSVAGKLSLTNLIVAGVTVAALPAAPAAGTMAYVTDGGASPAFGDTVTGGGSTKILVWFNGTNWTAIGK
jgi:hypothetical protein